jgi:hypothetical protein
LIPYERCAMLRKEGFVSHRLRYDRRLARYKTVPASDGSLTWPSLAISRICNSDGESGQGQFFQVSHPKRCKHAKYEIKFRPPAPQILKSMHGRNRQTLSQAHPAKTDVLSWSDAFLA